MLVQAATGFSRPKFLLAVLIVVVFGVGFFAPGAASAETLTVNTVEDEEDATPGTPCNTAANKCSLRAAIEVGNSTPAVADVVTFQSPLFDGEYAGSTISIADALPAITSPLAINSGTCPTDDDVLRPCVGVYSSAGNAAFTVEADDTSISGVAIAAASTAINVFGAEDFTATGNWIGLNLDGGSASNTVGIFVDPFSNGATIGGTQAVQRNVFANTVNEALDILGADEAVVQGNYFGVEPDGETPAANGKNVEISDSAGIPVYKAENNEIGAAVEPSFANTAACDGGCNVISGSSINVDLEGNGAGQNEGSATGPTVVRGNYVGLQADGLDVVPNLTQFGVYVGASRDTTIGGPAAGEENFIGGGGYGVFAEYGTGLSVVGNRIGIGPTGIGTSPSTVGIFAISSLVFNSESEIVGNVIGMEGGTGIEQVFGDAEIRSNSIEGGTVGILAKGSGLTGTLIAENQISSAADTGIELQGDEADVIGNEILEAGDVGIEVASPFVLSFYANVNGNRIGGDSTADENLISGSGDGAISLVTTEESINEIGRNRGSGNAEFFIRLSASQGGEEGPNEGIKPPHISGALQSSASGAADTGSKVQIFRKADAEEGEIAGFVGEATAGAGGEWKATFPTQPVGTVLVATQTSVAGGTSELSDTVTVGAEPENCDDTPAAAMCVPPHHDPPTACPESGCGAPCPPLLGKDCGPVPAAPQTTITKAPKAKSTKTTAKFKFKSSVAGSTFQCKLDKKPFKKCKSPKAYKKLKPGKHVFKVRAAGPGGTDTTPATRKFTILE